MFTYDGKRLTTWNVFTGCEFNCSYCWSRKLVETRLKNSPRYLQHGFKPTFHLDALNKKFRPDDFVFISSMGDISFASQIALNEIFKVINAHPLTKFLFCTKRPSIYAKFPDMNNVYYGTTIETNRQYPKTISKGQDLAIRYAVMANLENVKKFISIEPVMDFDLEEFPNWIINIKPKIVEIGCDGYHNNLPEPDKDKLESLIYSLEKNNIEVIQKKGLERLLK